MRSTFARWLTGDWLPRLFLLLYIAIAVATFRHTALGFASIEGGSVVFGALSALAVDAGMILSATGLRRSRNVALIIGLIVSAVASTYAQLLYSVSTAASVSVAPGASWMNDSARTIIDLRVVVLPALLPLLSVVYAFAAKRTHAQPSQQVRKPGKQAQPTGNHVAECDLCDWSNNGYETELRARRAVQGHKTVHREKEIIKP
jgi:glucan phosphoethanolaminetransferase (alkaline phosphatase superfamily)